MVMQNLGGRGKPGSMVYVKNGELFTKVNLGKSGYHKWVIIQALSTEKYKPYINILLLLLL